ncbi:MAG: hypothetical protein H7177_06575 [Rhizobacter sp.]|nr:hypothetical protein [Bacteriovorax sp.]
MLKAIVFCTLLLVIDSTGFAKTTGLTICSLDNGFGIYTKPDGNGIWQKIVKNSVKDLDISLKFIYAPRARCLLKIKKGGADAVYAGVTEDKKTYMVFPQTKAHVEDISRSIGQIQYKIYKMKGNNVLWNGKIFTNLGTNTIGVQRGLQIEQSLRDNHVKVEGDLVASPEQNLKKLILGRIVAAAIEEQQADEVITKNGYDGIMKFPKSYSNSEVHLAFSYRFYQEHHDLVEKIWDNIRISIKAFPKYNPAAIHINKHLQTASI